MMFNIKKNKFLFIFLVFFILFLSLTTVSANSSNTDDINCVLGNENLQGLSIENFTTLNNVIIDSESDGIVNLTNDVIQSDLEKDNFINGININKNLTIEGNGHKIDANNYGRIFKIENNVKLTLNNLTLINGNSTDDGGAIYCNDNVHLISSSASFINNSASDGGAIGSYGNLTILSGNSNFINNSANRTGGAIYSKNGTVFIMGDVNFINNKAIFLINSNDTNSSNSTIYGYGGAIESYYGDVIVKGNMNFINNSASCWGGAIDSWYDVTVFGNFTFFNNSANGDEQGYGGAIESFYGNVNVSGNVSFVNNIASRWGGAIDADSNVFISGNVVFFDNLAMDAGGAIFSLNSSVILKDNIIFVNNSAIYHGGAIFTNHTLIFDGDILFVNNSARNGGAIASLSNLSILSNFSNFINNRADEKGGAIFANSTLNFDGDAFFISNAARNGGAIASLANFTMISDFSSFINNSADENGGAIYSNNGSVNIVGRFFFINNSANGLEKAYGGAIESYYGSVSVIGNVSFINNSANGGEKGYGGAIDSWNYVSVIGNVSFINNSAKGSNFSYGGAIESFYSSVSVMGNIDFINNSANRWGGAIDSCNVLVNGNVSFYNNTAVNGSAIFVNGTGNISNSYFNSLGDNLIYLYNGSLFLDNNIMEYKNHAIYINEGNISSLVKLIYDNKTISSNNSVLLTADLTDDNGNRIYYNKGILFTLNSQNSTNGTFDFNSSKYTTIYNLSKFGDYNISGKPILLNNYTVINGILNYKKGTSLTIDGNKVFMYYKNGTKLIVYLKDSNNKALANNSLVINVNGVDYTRISDENGSAYLNINLDSGHYFVNISFNGSKLYGSSNINSTIDVLSTINGKDISKVYRNDTQYYASFTDGNGRPLKNTTVTFNIEGVFYNRTTDINGTAKLNINLNPREYILTAYNPVNNQSYSNKIIVLSSLISKDLIKYYKNDSQFYVKVINNQGNLISGKTISFNINGVFYNRTSDSNGTVKLNINLDSGKYIITSIDPDNGLMVSNNITVLSRLIASDITMKNKDGTFYAVKLLDNQGNPMASKEILMNINGIFYKKITDFDGIAKLKINLDPKTYIITSYYADLFKSNTILVKP